MNTMRNFLCVLTAVMLAAFALPGMADSNSRTFSLAMCVGSWSADLSTPPNFSCTPTPGVLSAKIKNTTTANVGGATSAILFVDTGWQIGSVSNIKEDGVPVRGTTDVSTPGQFSVAGLPPLKPLATLTMDFTVSTGSCGDGTWSAGVWTGTPPPSGQAFIEDQDPLSQHQTSVSCGLLACPTTFTVTRADTLLQAGTVSGTVWNPDKIGECKADPAYFLTNDILNTSAPFVHWRLADEFEVVSYTVNIPGPTTPTAKVGWLRCGSNGGLADGTDPNSVLGCTITPPACLAATPPQAAYGTLAATVLPGATTVQVNLSVPFSKLPARPFPIEIVNDGYLGAERMLVTKATGSGTFTVTRCDGFTCDVNSQPTHTFGSNPTTKYVMGTLLPTLAVDYLGNAYSFPAASPQALAGYKVGMQAQMCLTSLSGPIPDPTNNSQTYFKTTIFDQGDGWTGH